jgi:hypothetical protein
MSQTKRRGAPPQAQTPLEQSSAAEWVSTKEQHAISNWENWDHKRVPAFRIYLDLPPEDRFAEVATFFRHKYAEFFARYAKHVGVHRGAKKLTMLRGEEVPELMGEIRGVSKILGIPEYWIHAQQLASALQPLKGPFLDAVDSIGETLPVDGVLEPNASSVEFLNHFTLPSIGNTGILGRDNRDGSVWHARNLGFAVPEWTQKMLYTATFMRGDREELYTAQMVFPLQHVFTGVRFGHRGYSFQLNTRYLNSKEESELLVKNVYKERRVPTGWTIRKVMEDTENYNDAVAAFSTARLPNPEYMVISGVRAGTIIARDPDEVAYRVDLGKHRYLVLANSDYTKDDDNDEFVMTSPQKGVSARERAQSLLDKDFISPMLLQNVLNDDAVLSKDTTIFQTMINVEHGMFSTILLHCSKCNY